MITPSLQLIKVFYGIVFSDFHIILLTEATTQRFERAVELHDLTHQLDLYLKSEVVLVKYYNLFLIIVHYVIPLHTLLTSLNTHQTVLQTQPPFPICPRKAPELLFFLVPT